MRRRTQLDDARRDQRSIRYYWSHLGPEERAPLDARKDYSRSTYAYMLIEDVHNTIMPFRTGSRSRPFSVRVEPPSDSVAQLIETALRPEYARNLTDAVCDFVRDCASALLTFGEAFYELVSLFSPRDRNHATGFEIVRVPTPTVFRRRGQLVQYVPASIASHLGIEQWITLPPQSMLAVHNPLGPRMARLFEDLSLVGAGVMPQFAVASMMPGAPDRVPFDLQLYVRTQNIVAARCTREIGWNGRGLFQREAVDYYTTMRELRFEKFKMNLRQAILAMLNEALKRAGSRMGFDERLVLDGLPSHEDVARSQRQLETGEVGFDEILRRFRLS